VQAIVGSVSKIAQGAIADAASWIEKAMARAIPVMISFLASLLGLGGIADKVKGIIGKLQKRVDAAIDKVIEKIVAGVKKLFGRGKGTGGTAQAQQSPQSNSVKAKIAEELGGKTIQDGKTAETLTSDIYDRYRPKGLKGIRLDVDKKNPDRVNVKVNASLTEVVAQLKRSPKLIRIAGNLVPYSKKTSLYVHFDGGKPFGPSGAVENPFTNSKKGHAERNFVRKIPSLLRLIEARRAAGKLKTPLGEPVPVTLDINRSPCEHCAPILADAASKYADTLKFALNMGSVYKADWQSVERTSAEHLIAMHNAGIQLNALKVWKVIKSKLQAAGVKEIGVGGRIYNLEEWTGSFASEEASMRVMVEDALEKVRSQKPVSDASKGTT
jgi:hypothetical protein